MRLKNEKWQDIASKAGYVEGYEFSHDLLADILEKIYWNTSKDSTRVNRKLCKSPIYGHYGAKGIIYAVEGSPPKGSIYVVNIHVHGEIFYYDRCVFKPLWKFKKYHNLERIAQILAEKDLDEIKNKTKA